MKIQNLNCDGSACKFHNGITRVLPTSKDTSGGNVLLCRECFEHEMQWRIEKNQRLAKWDCLTFDPDKNKFPIPKWEDLEKTFNEPTNCICAICCEIKDTAHRAL